MPYISSRIRQKNAALFELARQLDLQIGWFVVATDTDRDNIPSYVRLTGAECKVLSSAEAGDVEAIYKLESDLTTWTLKNYGDYIPLAQKGQPSGVVPLDSDGYISPDFIKNLFISDVYVVSDTAEMLALTTLRGNAVIISGETDSSDDSSVIDGSVGNVYLKLNNNDPASLSDFANLTSAIGVATIKLGEIGTWRTGSILVTIAELIANTTDFTAFDDAVAAATAVASNISAIAALQATITIINDAITDLQEVDAAIGGTIYTWADDQEWPDDSYVWASGRIYHSITAVPTGKAITDTAYWETFGGYPEDVLTDGDVETTLTGTSGKIPDSHAVKTYVDDDESRVRYEDLESNLSGSPGIVPDSNAIWNFVHDVFDDDDSSDSGLSGVPGGSIGQIQYNLSGDLFGGFGSWDSTLFNLSIEGTVDPSKAFQLAIFGETGYDYNIAIGSGSKAIGRSDLAIGQEAGNTNSGEYNTALGFQAGKGYGYPKPGYNYLGDHATVIGAYTSANNGGTAIGDGAKTTAINSGVLAAGNQGAPDEINNVIADSWLMGITIARLLHLVQDMTNGHYVKLYGTAVSGYTTAIGNSTTLHDSHATFLSDNIQAGDIINNVTDGSEATVVSVDSDVQITTTALSGGIGNIWDDSNVYMLYLGGGRIRFSRANGWEISDDDGLTYSPIATS